MISSRTQIVDKFTLFRDKRTQRDTERDRREELKKVIGSNERELTLCDKFRTSTVVQAALAIEWIIK